MLKTGYIIALLSGVGLFNSCTANFINLPKNNQYTYMEKHETAYGNYLAGRLAHIRQDYSKASDFYIKTMENGLVNKDILGKTYIILASQGKIDEAIKYAKLARENGDKNNFIDVINAVYEFKHGNYENARNQIKNIKEKAYEELISPLFNAWSYVGENNYKEAIKQLDKLKDSEEMKTVYFLHKGLISEYLGFNEETRDVYDKIIADRSSDLSFRALQLISNFFVKQNEKEKASDLVTRYYGTGNLKEMLINLNKKIKESNQDTPLIVDSVNKGAGEVFLEVALLFKSIPSGYEYAQMYMAISEYFNPNNDVTKVAMADLFEDRYMLKEANRYYDFIEKSSEMYFPAQIKKANNLSTEKNYTKAEKVLKRLLKDNPENFQVLFNLGDVLRVNNKFEEAIKYYNKAIDSIFYEDEKYWPVYYALAVAYDKNNNWEKAEESLNKALKLSHRHPHVLNYLGYSWLKNNEHTEDAAAMIVEAYEKEPNDGVIMDSLGWVYFKMGNYDNAISYLERASELNPSNAVISDHLGDAYWCGGRKNEAIFLWKQALKQKEEIEEVNIKQVKRKIQNGLKPKQLLSIKDERINDILKSFEDITN